MQWHDCYYHFWSAVLLNEGCCQASCMGMIILRGICGLVPPGWMWWMGRKWWCLKHSQVLPDPSHSIITVTQFDWAQTELRPHETHWRPAPWPHPCPQSIRLLNRCVKQVSSHWCCWIEAKAIRDFLFCFVCTGVFCTKWEMCWVDTLFAIWRHFMLPNAFYRLFFLDPESGAGNVASRCAIQVNNHPGTPVFNSSIQLL